MMTDKEILAGAPEGANIVDMDNLFFDGYGNQLSKNGKWSISNRNPHYPRSLADIRALVEKDERIKELDKERVELQSYAVRVVTFIICAVEKLRDIPEFKPTGDVLNRAIKLTPKIALEAHNLEQQISAVKQLISNVGVFQGSESVGCYLDYDMVIDELNKLKAKQLREGVEPKQPGWLRDNNTHTGEGVE